MKLSKAIEDYLRFLRISQRSKRTIEVYSYDLNKFLKFVNDIPIKDASKKVIDYIANLEVKKNSLARIISELKNFFNHFKINPQFPKIKTEKNLPRTINDRNKLKEFRSWLPERERLIFDICLYCGLRIQEVLSLTKDNIQDNFLIFKGKGDKERIVPIPDFLKKELFKYKNQSQKYLFTNKSGKPLTRQWISKVFKKVSKKVGIKITPHCLRHTFASYLINNGMDIYHLAKLLGHSSVSTTQIYAQLKMENLKEKIQVINNIL